MKKTVLFFLVLTFSFPLFNLQATVHRVKISWTSDKTSIPAILFEAISEYAKKNEALFTKHRIKENVISIKDKDYTKITCLKKKSAVGKPEYLVEFEQYLTDLPNTKYPVVHLSQNASPTSIAAIVHNALVEYAKKRKASTIDTISDYGRIVIDDGNRLVSDEASSDEFELWLIKKKLDVVTLDSDIESLDPTIVRVGSPLYNWLRDLRRSAYPVDGGPGMDHDVDQILTVEKWKNVGANDLLIIRKISFFGTDPVDRGKLDVRQTGIKYYALDQVHGLMEMSFETLKYTLLMGFGRGAIGPVAEIVLASISDEALGDRLHNDLLSVWDSTKGIGLSVYDIFDKASEGDVMRSVKAVVRLPFNVAGLGLTVVNKALSLPFELIKSAVGATVDIFSDDNDYELEQRIENNNDYEVDLTINSIGYKGSAKFDKRGRHARFSLSRISRSKSATTFRGSWEIIRFENEQYFHATLKLGKKDFVLIGKVEGNFDIDIEGKILRQADFDGLVQNKKRTLKNIRRAAIGFFTLDD